MVLKDGEIVETGKYDELLNLNGEFGRLVQVKREEEKIQEESKRFEESLDEDLVNPGQNLIKEDSENLNLDGINLQLKLAKEWSRNSKLREIDEEVKLAEDRMKKEEKEMLGKLIEEEELGFGRIKVSTFGRLFMYGGSLVCLIIVLFYIGEVGLNIVSEWWLGIWAIDEYNKSSIWYFQYYCLISLGICLSSLLGGLVFTIFISNLAKNSQMRLIDVLLKSPLRWFDTTPRGRIIKRAVKDQNKVDEDIPGTLTGVVSLGLSIIASLTIVCIVTPYFAIPIFLLTILYFYYYTNTIQFSRDAARLETKSQSPIFSLFEQTLDGLTTIRAYNLNPLFIGRMEEYLDGTQGAELTQSTGMNWLNVRLRLMGSVIVGLACFLVYIGRESISNNMAGLSILNSFQVISELGHFLLLLGSLEAEMASLERILEYIRTNPQERPFKYANPRVREEWPERGKLEVNNLSLRYEDSLPLVIKGISFDCAPGERVGIVGRTGSGKSTLTLGLLRILEPFIQDDQLPHNILIDDVNVCDIGLHELREKIAIIPQDPLLFSGSIATNLDPFHTTSLDQKMKALELTGLIHQLSKKIQVENKEKEEEKKAEENEEIIEMEPKLPNENPPE